MRTYSKIEFIFLVVTTIMILISSCSTFFSQQTPTLTPSASTETSIPSFTPTVINTVTPSLTPSSIPTNTSTPQPGWVTDFAQPIIDAIADRSPNFQDDFGPGSAGWKEDWCPGSMRYIEGELVITNCRVYRPNTDWRDFALEVDMRFLESSNSFSEWSLHFRDLGNSGHILSLYHNGSLAISFTKAKGTSNRMEFDDPALSDDQIHHILLIAQGNRFAFYLDDRPLHYVENDAYRFGRCVFFSESGAVAMDNIKIWDISDVPNP